MRSTECSQPATAGDQYKYYSKGDQQVLIAGTPFHFHSFLAASSVEQVKGDGNLNEGAGREEKRAETKGLISA